MRHTTHAPLAAAGALCIGLTALAGPLNPPAGPVASTHKTLTEVEPRIAINAVNTPGDADSLFKITQRGSYYLTGNITGVAARHGIEIAASDVTLDLMGFELAGVAGGEIASLDGISATAGPNVTGITVRNGTVRRWGGDGVDLRSATQCTVTGVFSGGFIGGENLGDGIAVGTSSVVSNSGACNNEGNGIVAGTSCIITSCTSKLNTRNGIDTDSGTLISNCSTDNNGQDGISAGSVCAITACTSYLNGGDGFAVGSNGTITGCTAGHNTGNGVTGFSNCTITGCTSSQNVGHGVSVFTASQITASSAHSNAASGISVGSGSTVSNCVANANDLDGIVASASCLILANTCSINGNAGDGAGIHTTDTDNRIEGNTCTSQDRGIDVDIPGNFIVKNTCSGNTFNWTIAANNVCGPILDRSAPASAAINGNSAPSSLGTTDANANFTQ